jgi:hypothetical protein
MSPERQAIILSLESLISLEQEHHELQITITALARAFRAISQSNSDLLTSQIRDVREELVQYAPDARVQRLTEMIQELRAYVDPQDSTSDHPTAQ